MTVLNRFSSFLTGLIIILFALLLVSSNGRGLTLIIVILGFSLFVDGIRYLRYYLRMGRHMVGGKMIFFVGLIYFDFGLVTMGLRDSHPVIIVIYLLGFHAFTGMVDVMRALEARRYTGTAWKLKLVNGIVNIIIAITAFSAGVFLKSPLILVDVYSFGLLYEGIMRIITAFRRTTIVYVP